MSFIKKSIKRLLKNRAAYRIVRYTGLFKSKRIRRSVIFPDAIQIKGTQMRIAPNIQKGFNDLYYLGIDGQADAFTLEVVMKLSQRVKTLWDVGAYIGLDALVSLHFNKDLKIVAFEPNPDNFKLLEENIRLNGELARGIQALHMGLGKENGNQTFYFSKRNPLMGSLNPIKDFVAQEVRVCTGDALIDQGEVCIPELIKLDVEGYEPGVLTGCSGLLKTKPIIIIEVLTEKTGSMVEEVLPEGYEFYGIVEETRQLVKKESLKRLSKTSKNYLLIDKSQTEDVLSLFGH